MASLGAGPFQHRDFRLFQLARLLVTLALQMQSVAIGWQVYALTHRTLDLGWVGFSLFLPAILLSLVTGHVADRFDRRRVLAACYGSLALTSLVLLALSRAGLSTPLPIYAAAFLVGTARAFSGPSGQALMPSLVPKEQLSVAVAWSSSVWEVATIAGPACGGALYASAGHPWVVYAATSACAAGGAVAVASLAVREATRERRATSWTTLLAGVRYVFAERIVLATISLDLFAVLLGGAVALLPAYASDVLHAGPTALGLMRSAPAAGALVVAVLLARFPIARHAGPLLLVCVALFGVATIVFGVSRSLPLSLASLFVLGAADMVSVVIRMTLVQLATPEAMRGRVSAVNLVFIGASNELGEFESGVTAAWLGLVPAVVAGGVGTLLVVVAWAWLFPELRRIDRLEAPERAAA